MELLNLLIAYLIIGFFAGIIGGLLGIGGGVITVPALFFIFKEMGYPQNELMQLAIGTSLGAMIFNTVSATWSHHRNQSVIWPILRQMIPGFIVGSFIGAIISTSLPQFVLKVFFTIFLLILAFLFLKDSVSWPRLKYDSSFRMLFCGSLIIGCFSNLLGIGGGVMTVPFLLSLKIEDKKAIGTSAAATLLICFLGAISYVVFGWNKIPTYYNWGYVNLPAALTIGLVTFCSSPIGVYLTHSLPTHVIRKIFAIVLIIMSLSFIFTNLLFAF